MLTSICFELSTGWLYGEFEGKSGSFPEEYTAPIVCGSDIPTEVAIQVSLKITKLPSLLPLISKFYHCFYALILFHSVTVESPVASQQQII